MSSRRALAFLWFFCFVNEFSFLQITDLTVTVEVEWCRRCSRSVDRCPCWEHPGWGCSNLEIGSVEQQCAREKGTYQYQDEYFIHNHPQCMNASTIKHAAGMARSARIRTTITHAGTSSGGGIDSTTFRTGCRNWPCWRRWLSILFWSEKCNTSGTWYAGSPKQGNRGLYLAGTNAKRIINSSHGMIGLLRVSSASLAEG